MKGIGLVPGAGLAAGCATQPESKTEVEGKPQSEEKQPKTGNLPLYEYDPQRLLHAHKTQLPRAKSPVIDFHTHISVSTKSEKGVELSPDRQYLGTDEE